VLPLRYVKYLEEVIRQVARIRKVPVVQRDGDIRAVLRDHQIGHRGAAPSAPRGGDAMERAHVQRGRTHFDHCPVIFVVVSAAAAAAVECSTEGVPSLPAPPCIRISGGSSRVSEWRFKAASVHGVVPADHARDRQVQQSATFGPVVVGNMQRSDLCEKKRGQM